MARIMLLFAYMSSEASFCHYIHSVFIVVLESAQSCSWGAQKDFGDRTFLLFLWLWCRPSVGPPEAFFPISLQVCLCVLVCVHGGIVWPACQRFTLLCLIVRMFQVNNAHFFTRWHTYTHPFNGPLSGTTQVNWYQKGKTSLDFTEARVSEW